MVKFDINKEMLKRILIIFFAVIGFFTTVKLAIIYYESNFDAYALPSFCSINEIVDCDGVAQTTHSQFFGIPLAYWGMGLYVFLILLTLVDYLKKIKFLSFLEVFKNPFAYISALGFISFAISMILLGISVFEIKKICILCLFTYILNLIIAFIATDFEDGVLKGIWSSFKASVIDFVDALKVKKYLISFLSLALIASGVLAYTTLSFCFTPQVKRYKSITEFSKLKTNPFAVTGNILGDPDGKVIVNLYSDYRCPICYTQNLMIHRIAKELKGFKIVAHNLPLDTECNRYLKHPFHEGSCMMAKYSIAAEDQGRLWDLNSELFEKQPKTEDEILKLAKSVGLDTIKLREDANSFETSEKLSKDIDQATGLGLDGTPALVIKGKVYSGVKPYYELKDIFIKAGAVERK